MSKITKLPTPKTYLAGPQRSAVLFLWRNGEHQLDDTWRRLSTHEIASALRIEEFLVYNTIAHAGNQCEWQQDDD